MREHAARLAFLFFPLVLSSSDPIENIVSNFMLTVRSMGEKWLTSVNIPRTEDVNANPNIAFSIDRKTANALTSMGNFLNPCPVYLPVDNVEGTWYVIFASRRLLETTLSDIHEVIDRLASSRPLQSRKSLDSLFRSSLDLQCAQMTVLQSSQPRFEWSYSIGNTPYSIIGELQKRTDRSFILSFAPTTEIHMAATWTDSSVVIFSSLDSFPPCDNQLVFVRDRTIDTSIIRERIRIQGGDLPSNPLLPIGCKSSSIKPIISAVPSGPSQPQPWFSVADSNPWSSNSLSSANSLDSSPLQSPSLSPITIPSLQSFPQSDLRSPIVSQPIQPSVNYKPSPARLSFNSLGRAFVQVVDPTQ